MKKQTETWLGLFKKTLKVSGYVLLTIIFVIGVGIYFAIKQSSYTYLACLENPDDDKNYIAFNDRRLLFGWDPVEEEFVSNIKIIEFNKKKIKAVFYVEKKDSSSLATYEEEPIGEAIIVSKAYIGLDRETGEYQLSFDDTGMKGNKENCVKIRKNDLPIKKINQKF